MFLCAAVQEPIEDSGDSSETDTEPQIKPKTLSYYIVSFNTKKTAKYYIGQLLNEGTVPSEDEYNFKFLRYSRKTAGHFIWPDCDDEAVASLQDIKRELSTPKSARRGGGLLFLPKEIGPYMKWIH